MLAYCPRDLRILTLECRVGHDVIEKRLAKPKSAQIDDMLVRKDAPSNRIHRAQDQYSAN